MRESRTHYLGHNKVERSPKRVVYLDSETRWAENDGDEVHTLRLWVAQLAVRGGTPRTTVETHWAQGHTGPALAERLETWARTKATLWVFAHNLTFDLCVCRIVQNLIRRGWDLNDHALTNDSPWARLSKGRTRIVLADSASWLPRSIEHLGALLRLPKLDLDLETADDAALFDYCRRDVEILAAAMGAVLDDWDRLKLGCWSLTGTGTGWNSYRHHPHLTRTLIDPDPAARTFERGAIYAGRRDAWRVGEQPTGRYIQLDLERAHLAAAIWFPLPHKRLAQLGPTDPNDWQLAVEGVEPMLDCTVRTDTRRYPWRHADRVWHPVGTFRTVLAGPEVRDAQQRGQLEAVHGGYLYLTDRIMESWGRWLAAILDGEGPDVSPCTRVWAKMCSHRVFGRWALRTARPTEPWFSGKTTWAHEIGWAHPEEARCSTFHLDGWAHTSILDQEGDDSFPAVLAWIQAHVRVALGKLIDALDPQRIVSCNTDGVLYRANVDPDMTTLARATYPFVPRIKSEHHHLDVLGAAHLVADGELKLSGVPSSAEPTGEQSLQWLTWPRMRRQLAMSREDGYVRELREVDLGNVPVTAWVLPNNTTKPIVTYMINPYTTRVYPYLPRDSAGVELNIAERQHPMLQQLLADHATQPPAGSLP